MQCGDGNREAIIDKKWKKNKQEILKEGLGSSLGF
jgi:hypothetical protein